MLQIRQLVTEVEVRVNGFCGGSFIIKYGEKLIECLSMHVAISVAWVMGLVEVRLWRRLTCG